MCFSLFIREHQFLSKRLTHHPRVASPSGCPQTRPRKMMKDTVLRMREKGLKATGCNFVIRATTACLKWADSLLKIPQLKGPQLVLPTFSAGALGIPSERAGEPGAACGVQRRFPFDDRSVRRGEGGRRTEGRAENFRKFVTCADRRVRAGGGTRRKAGQNLKFRHFGSIDL